MGNTIPTITNGYEFISWFVNIFFSWQVITFVIVMILIKPIKDLLSRVKYFKHNDIEISFSKRMKKLNIMSKLIKNKDITEINKKSLFIKRVNSISKISPVSVIFFAYQEIENTFTNEYEVIDDKFRCKIIDEISLDLYEAKLITKENYNLFNEMTNIYNTVLNNKNAALSIKKKMAIIYGKTAKRIIDRIEELKGR